MLMLDLFTNCFGCPGGRASAQLDHGLEKASGEAALAADLITATPISAQIDKQIEGKLSIRIKDAGIAIRHSRGYIFYTAGSRNGLEGVGKRGHTHRKSEVDPKKNIRFCYRKIC